MLKPGKQFQFIPFPAANLHSGNEDRGRNLAFPLTPPEPHAGTAYRFKAYHVMEIEELAPLFPLQVEDI